MAGMEVAGGSRQGPFNKASRGELLPDVMLPSADGRQIRLSNYRGRLNLVLVLAGQADDKNVLQLLEEVAGRYAEFAGEESEVVAILLDDCSRQDSLEERAKDWPFVVLSDTEGQMLRSFKAFKLNKAACPTIFVADRYGEIYVEYRAQGWREFPKIIDEILQWLVFINSQCPECGAPEWSE